jgi:hypothetical protein
MSACVRIKCGTSESLFFFAVRRNLCAMRVVNWRCNYDCVDGVAKETKNEALSSSLGTVSSVILIHGVLYTVIFCNSIWVKR